MKKAGFAFLLMIAVACNNEKGPAASEEESKDSAFKYETFSERFTAASLPYQLTDTGLLQHADTAAIRNAGFVTLIADSINQKLLGSTKNVKYIPLAKINVPKGESYFILKAEAGKRKGALLAVFDKEKKYSAAFPFLIPDEDANTSQASSIDRAYSISRNVARKGKDNLVIEGKDVYAYNAAVNNFTLIMTDVLDDKNQELINPIDTFASTHKFAGDYVKDKRNIISVRDGRTPNELTVFVHIEKEKGACTGEVKGEALFTSSTTAVYRQGGDPCVLEFKFSATSVTMREVEGCGLHRGERCLFEGTYPRKKEPKAKTDTKKVSKK